MDPRLRGDDEERANIPFRLPGNPQPAPASLCRPTLPPPAIAIKSSTWHGGCKDHPAIIRDQAVMAENDLFGIHGAALAVRSQRMATLASNIANASTPGYKAKDVDFAAALKGAETGRVDAVAANTKYRLPTQMSMDGNTVELATEQTAFAENAVAYQTTLSFLNGRIATITRALKGE